ncbi:uncharacterized protein [Thunnus thynnus]|uniref:uncharacterized protein n=1 Tax=Thunnus thynnus TaxID=8237 RepID=UPI003528E9E5
MAAKQLSSLLTEMEIVKTLMKLTPEERHKEVRRRTYIELRAVEKGRRERIAQEIAERRKREKEEREKAIESQRIQKEKLEEKIRQEQERLRKERLEWKRVMRVEEQLWLTSPMHNLTTVENQPRVEDAASPKRLTSDLKAKEQEPMKTLHNNWVGEENTDSKPVKEKSHSVNSVFSLFTVKPSPEPEEKQPSPKSVQERLSLGCLIEMFQACSEITDESHILESEEQNVGATRAGSVTPKPETTS